MFGERGDRPRGGGEVVETRRASVIVRSSRPAAPIHLLETIALSAVCGCRSSRCSTSTRRRARAAVSGPRCPSLSSTTRRHRWSEVTRMSASGSVRRRDERRPRVIGVGVGRGSPRRRRAPRRRSHPPRTELPARLRSAGVGGGERRLHVERRDAAAASSESPCRRWTSRPPQRRLEARRPRRWTCDAHADRRRALPPKVTERDVVARDARAHGALRQPRCTCASPGRRDCRPPAVPRAASPPARELGAHLDADGAPPAAAQLASGALGVGTLRAGRTASPPAIKSAVGGRAASASRPRLMLASSRPSSIRSVSACRHP